MSKNQTPAGASETNNIGVSNTSSTGANSTDAADTSAAMESQSPSAKSQSASTEAQNPDRNMELRGNIKNLINIDIVVLAGRNHSSTFKAEGNLIWHSSGEQTKVLTIGNINALFMLMKPTVKISEQEAKRIYCTIPLKERYTLEQTLWYETQSKKSQAGDYFIITETAAIAAYVLHCNLKNMLVPAFTVRVDGQQKVRAGFIPTGLLFELSETRE